MMDSVEGLGTTANAMLQALGTHGPSMSNRALRQAVGLEEDLDAYLEARDLLLGAQLETRGPGQGGTLRLARDHTDDLDLHRHEVGDSRYKKESDLYEPMHEVVRTGWAQWRGATPVATQITAQGGKKDTGGVWSRPDITCVELRTFSYVPGRHLDVVSYEVKPVDAISIQGVYEALAHRRAAHRSFLLIHVPLKDFNATATDVERVCRVAREQGIGVIVAHEPDDVHTWSERVPAERVSTDPERIERFISTQLHDEQQAAIAKVVDAPSSGPSAEQGQY